jgi:hypothetical protein
MPAWVVVMTEIRKAWQEPMVWLMVGIPFLTVIAGFYTLYLAINAGPLDPPKISVQRIAQAQTVNNSIDEYSTAQKYYAFLIIDKSQPTWKLSLKTIPSNLIEKDINIVFVHPQRADQDITIQLPKNQDTIQMPTTVTFKPHQIVVSDAKGQWRLVGVDNGSNQIILTPVLSNQ